METLLDFPFPAFTMHFGLSATCRCVILLLFSLARTTFSQSEPRCCQELCVPPPLFPLCPRAPGLTCLPSGPTSIRPHPLAHLPPSWAQSPIPGTIPRPTRPHPSPRPHCPQPYVQWFLWPWPQCNMKRTDEVTPGVVTPLKNSAVTSFVLP